MEDFTGENVATVENAKDQLLKKKDLLAKERLDTPPNSRGLHIRGQTTKFYVRKLLSTSLSADISRENGMMVTLML